MGRSTRFQELKKAHLVLDDFDVTVETHPPTLFLYKRTGLQISCRPLDWQLSSIAQVFTSFFPSIHMVEHLFVYELRHLPPRWHDDIENMQWLECFHLFTGVKNLYLPKKFVPSIAPALQELIGHRMTEVLPILQNIFLEGLQPSEPIEEGIQKFVAARQLSCHPITVSGW